MYQCNICSKEFKSERSLSGHRSSHNRNTETYRFNRSKKSPINQDSLETILPTPKNCNYCNKEFLNGWQLGGHKSKCLKNPIKQQLSETNNSFNTILSRAPDIKHVI